MLDSKNVKLKEHEEEMSAYRRDFPFRPQDAQCVLFEENEEVSVKIYRSMARGQSFDCFNEESLVQGFNRDGFEVRLERQAFSKNQETIICMFSERLSERCLQFNKRRNVYYTLQICDYNSCFALFRTFTANQTIANRLFECICSSDINCLNAIDIYRDARMLILRELWFYGF